MLHCKNEFTTEKKPKMQNKSINEQSRSPPLQVRWYARYKMEWTSKERRPQSLPQKDSNLSADFNTGTQKKLNEYNILI